MGYLSKLDYISCVSGGSVLAAYLGMQWKHLNFRDRVAENFFEIIVSPLKKFCTQPIDVSTLLKGFFNPWKFRRPGNLLEKTYRNRLYGEATLQDFLKKPAFIICSTNLLTGETFTFSRERAGTYYKGIVLNPNIRLSECVAASSAFPPIFSPYRLELLKPQNAVLYPNADKRTQRHLQNEDIENDTADRLGHREKPENKRTFYLSDAGVISNLGIDEIDFLSEVNILVSNAGLSLREIQEGWFNTSWINLTYRASMIAAGQSDPLRLKSFTKGGNLEGPSKIIWSIDDCVPHVANQLISEKMVYKLSTIRTRLNSFSEKEQCQLINWGYICCALRTWKLTSQKKTSLNLPFPEYSLI